MGDQRIMTMETVLDEVHQTNGVTARWASWYSHWHHGGILGVPSRPLTRSLVVKRSTPLALSKGAGRVCKERPHYN
jgi:hypothetical protein